MVMLTNHVIDRTKQVSRIHCSEPLVLWRFSQNLLATVPSIGEGQKNVLPFELEALGTVPYGKSNPGYCITFIKRLHDGLR